MFNSHKKESQLTSLFSDAIAAHRAIETAKRQNPSRVQGIQHSAVPVSHIVATGSVPAGARVVPDAVKIVGGIAAGGLFIMLLIQAVK